MSGADLTQQLANAVSGMEAAAASASAEFGSYLGSSMADKFQDDAMTAADLLKELRQLVDGDIPVKIGQVQQALDQEKAEQQAYVRLVAAERAKARRAQELAEESGETAAVDRYRPGGDFLLDVSDQTPAVWGAGSQVVWSRGESLIIAGGSGLGKTTLSGQLVMARLGLFPSVLGLPVTEGMGRVLYLAMDRPAQTRRALKRLVTPENREVLNDRLVFWEGPPLEDMAVNTALLAQMCAEAGADLVVVDSLKDAALGLSDDVVGGGWNRSRQTALAAGVEVLELHHQVKRNSSGGAPDSLADVYGSGWITAGAGSVVVLTGNAGDPVVGLRHLKQPAEPVGPWQIQHDHDTGLSSVFHEFDLLELAKAGPLTAKGVASVVNGTHKPTSAEVEKYRRRLEKLAKCGHLTKSEGSSATAVATYTATLSVSPVKAA